MYYNRKNVKMMENIKLKLNVITDYPHGKNKTCTHAKY
jgi:hypothetical protein